MTERKTRTQGALNDSEQQLRTLVAEYEAQLSQTAEVVARVRHEINNPLTGVLGQAQLLLREELSEKARKRVLTIEELAVRLRDTVAELRQVQMPIRRSINQRSEKRADAGEGSP